jgi:hypothetical protein
MKLLLSIVLAAATGLAQAPNTLTPKEKAEGWILLFDGTSLDGWFNPDIQPPEFHAWTIVDGCLKSNPAPVMREDLITRRTFKDFELTFEWKVAKGANTGLKYLIQRVALLDAAQLEKKGLTFEQQVGEALMHPAKRDKVQPGSDAQGYPVGFEYQLIDDAENQDAIKHPMSRAGALYSMVAPSKAAARPAGEWNQSRIVLQGLHVQHFLNGEKVVDVMLDAPEVKAKIEARWPEGNPVRKLLLELPRRDAPISLQHHNDEAWFRNIKIKALKPAR